MTNKLSKHAGGGNTKFVPAKMNYDGVSGHYTNIAITTSGNKVTTILWFNREAFTGGGAEYLVRCQGPSHIRMNLQLWSSDHSIASRRNRLTCWISDSSGVNVCFLHTPDSVMDKDGHFILCAYDGDIGAATLSVDGIPAIDVDNPEYLAPAVATLAAGEDSQTYIGASNAAAFYFGNAIGYLGMADAYISDHSKFFDPQTGLKQIDEVTWDEFGGQPLVWNPHGDLENNRGSQGDFTKTGTITISDDNIETFPHLGLNTIGDATPADIAEGKIAWVDGEEIVGIGPSLLNGLVSWWELDEASGTRVDSHGSNDLTDNNTVTSAVGVDGGTAAQFTKANSESLSLTDEYAFGQGIHSWTLCGWLYPDTLVDDWAKVAYLGESGAGDCWFVDTHLGGTGRMRLIVASDLGNIQVQLTTSVLTTGKWHFFAATLDWENKELRIRVISSTGDDIATEPLGAAIPNVISTKFEVASRYGSQFTDGRIDKLARWNRVLTPGEILALYNDGTGKTYTNLTS